MAKITHWREKGNRIYSAVLILSLMPLIQGVVAIYDKWSDLGRSLMSLAGGYGRVTPETNSAGILVTALMVFAYVLYFTGLTSFAKLQTAQDSNSVLRIRTGAVWGVAAQFLGMISLAGWLLAFIANVVAFFVMISGYGRLRNSSTFPEEAARGAGRLRAAMIWSLVAAILHIIPLLGPVIAGIINFILFFVVLSGWSRIKRAEPLTIAGRTLIDRLKIKDAPCGAYIAWGLTLITAVVAIWDRSFVDILQSFFSWEVYSNVFYIVYILGLALILVGIVEWKKRKQEPGRDFTILIVACAIWLGSMIFEYFLYHGFRMMILDSQLQWMYRLVAVACIVVGILFIVGFRKMLGSSQNILLCEGVNFLTAYFALLIFQKLYVFEIVFIGEYRSEYYDLLPLFPWVYLYLGVTGWRAIASELYGKGEVVPADGLTYNSQSRVQSNPQPWICEETPADEDMLERMEKKSNDDLEYILANKDDYSQSFVRAAEVMLNKRQEEQAQEEMREKVSGKTDDELNNILTESDDYNPALVEAARKERELREQGS